MLHERYPLHLPALHKSIWGGCRTMKPRITARSNYCGQIACLRFLILRAFGTTLKMMTAVRQSHRQSTTKVTCSYRWA